MPEKCLKLKEYIDNYLEDLISVDATFGFDNPSYPENEQREYQEVSQLDFRFYY